MTEPYELHEEPELNEPVLITMLLGWIDAGGAAAAAMSVLENELAARPVATFDADTFIDYRARRPTMQLRDGVNTELVWPETRLLAGRDTAGHDVLLLSGHEPDANWRLFTDAASRLAIDLGTRMMVGLGAYPFATPHSRPSRLSMTAATAEVAASLPYLRNTVDVPAGIEAALERRFGDAGRAGRRRCGPRCPTTSRTCPTPAASMALLDGLQRGDGRRDRRRGGPQRGVQPSGPPRRAGSSLDRSHGDGAPARGGLRLRGHPHAGVRRAVRAPPDG